MLTQVRVILALGRDAFISLLHFFKGQGLIKRLADYPFVHGETYRIGEQWLVPCYHTSRYNVQTGRITQTMFMDVCARIQAMLRE